MTQAAWGSLRFPIRKRFSKGLPGGKLEKLLLRALGLGSLITEAPSHPRSLQKERVEIRPCRSDGVMGS